MRSRWLGSVLGCPHRAARRGSWYPAAGGGRRAEQQHRRSTRSPAETASATSRSTTGPGRSGDDPRHPLSPRWRRLRRLPVTFHDLTVRLSSTPVSPDDLDGDLRRTSAPTRRPCSGDLTLGRAPGRGAAASTWRSH
jgi:hypothetical protein